MDTTSHISRARRTIAAAAAVAFALAFGPGPAFARDTEDASGHGLVRTLLALPLEFVRTTSGFARRRHPIRKTMHFHQGVDFAAPHGTPVRSVDAGRVAFAGTQNGYGKVVYIDHGDGARTTVYAHLSSMDVRRGDVVRAGDTIGAVGSTGLSTGAHLHFEVHEGGKPVDPMQWALRSRAHPDFVHAGLSAAAIDGMDAGNLRAPIDAARCLELLQKFSLEALAPDELDFLRRGCAQ